MKIETSSRSSTEEEERPFCYRVQPLKTVWNGPLIPVWGLTVGLVRMLSNIGDGEVFMLSSGEVEECI